MSPRVLLAAALLLPALSGACEPALTPPPGDGGPGLPRGLDFPSGVALTARYLVVTEVAAQSSSTDFSRVTYGEGHVSFFDRTTLRRVARLRTTQVNPEYVVADPARERVYVINGGPIDASEDPAVASGPGGVDVFDLSGEGPPEGPALNVELAPVPGLPSAAPSRLALAPDGRTALVGSGVAPHLYKLDLESGQVLRGPDDPIAPFPESDALNGLTVPVIAGGRVLALNFNTDELCVAEDASAELSGDLEGARCADVGEDPSQLEGPLDVLVDPAAPDRAYVLFSLAGTVASVDLGTPGLPARRLAELGPVAPNALASCDGRRAYVPNSLENNLFAIDLETGETERAALFAPRSNPYLMALDCQTETAFVTQLVAGCVERVDLRSGEVEELVPCTRE